MGKTVLITGIDGFVAKHCAVAFLDAGYTVRGSVREPSWADEVCTTLAAHADVSRLDFVTADLLKDTGWDALEIALAGGKTPSITASSTIR